MAVLHARVKSGCVHFLMIITFAINSDSPLIVTRK